jgi:hypothetical protein
VSPQSAEGERWDPTAGGEPGGRFRSCRPCKRYQRRERPRGKKTELGKEAGLNVGEALLDVSRQSQGGEYHGSVLHHTSEPPRCATRLILL